MVHVHDSLWSTFISGMYHLEGEGDSVSSVITIKTDLGGCPNYGPFLDPYYNAAVNI